jgi:tRNA threonylcarbamoyladenosine biosynthesis protein TsaE
LEEALAIGIEEYLDGPEFCLIEWPEVIGPLLPDDVVSVEIEVLDSGARRISMET